MKRSMDLVGFPNSVRIHSNFVGAVHEMMRPDSNSFVEIIFDNIVPGQEGNFRRKASRTHRTHDTPFDWGSIMMYGPDDAGKLDDGTGTRMTTIRPKVPGVEIR